MNTLVNRSLFILCCFTLGALSPSSPVAGQQLNQEISPSWNQTLYSSDGQMIDCDSEGSWCVLDSDAVLDPVTGLVWERFPRSGASAPVFYDQPVALGSSGFDDGSSVEYTPSTPDERTHFHVEWGSDCIPATGSPRCQDRCRLFLIVFV